MEVPKYLQDLANEVLELQKNEHETALTGKKVGESGGVTSESYGLAEIRKLLNQKRAEYADEYNIWMEAGR